MKLINGKNKISKTLLILGIAALLVWFIIRIIAPMLIALNTTREINDAFTTLNEKLEDSRSLVEGNAENANDGFAANKLELRTNEDIRNIEFWENKALHIQKASAKMVGHILNDVNEVIKLSGNKDWVEERDKAGNITKLKPFNDLNKMDDQNTPTLYFLGKNGNRNKPDPNAAGVKLIKAIHAYRDRLTQTMGTYELEGKKYEFKAPKNESGLALAFKTCNPEDTSSIARVYRILYQPETTTTKYNGVIEERPYVSTLFYDAPLVACCAILTSMTVDIKNAAQQAAQFFLSKTGVHSFKFNEIKTIDTDLRVRTRTFERTQND